MRTLGRAVAAGVVLTLALTACSSSGDGDRGGSGRQDPSASETPHEPTLAERFYPETQPERVRVGSQDHADPCQVLPPADVIRIFGITPLDGVEQTATVGSVPLADAPEASCRFPLQGYALTATPEETKRWAAYNTRFRAVSIGGGIWFSADRAGAFDDAIEELRGSAPPAQVEYRTLVGTTTWQIQLDLPRGAGEEHFHPSARRAFALLRKRLGQRATLSQDLLGPVLRGEPYARGTRILDACELLSGAVLTGLSGSTNPAPSLVNSTTGWRHEDGTNTKRKWASPYTECAWGTGEHESADEYDVDLFIRSHPDVAEADRSFTASLERWGIVEQRMNALSAAEVDRGGWTTSTRIGHQTQFRMRIGVHVVELTVGTGDRAVIRTEPEMADAVAAIVERVRELAG